MKVNKRMDSVTIARKGKPETPCGLRYSEKECYGACVNDSSCRKLQEEGKQI